MASEVVQWRSLPRPYLVLVMENSGTRTGPEGVILGLKNKINFEESNNDFGMIFHIISNFLSVTAFENDYFAFLVNTCFWPISVLLENCRMCQYLWWLLISALQRSNIETGRTKRPREWQMTNVPFLKRELWNKKDVTYPRDFFNVCFILISVSLIISSRLINNRTFFVRKSRPKSSFLKYRMIYTVWSILYASYNFKAVLFLNN